MYGSAGSRSPRKTQPALRLCLPGRPVALSPCPSPPLHGRRACGSALRSTAPPPAPRPAVSAPGAQPPPAALAAASRAPRAGPPGPLAPRWTLGPAQRPCSTGRGRAAPLLFWRYVAVEEGADPIPAAAFPVRQARASPCASAAGLGRAVPSRPAAERGSAGRRGRGAPRSGIVFPVSGQLGGWQPVGGRCGRTGRRGAPAPTHPHGPTLPTAPRHGGCNLRLCLQTCPLPIGREAQAFKVLTLIKSWLVKDFTQWRKMFPLKFA